MPDINWTPLETYIRVVGRHRPALDCSDFMYMGVAYANPHNAYREMGPKVYLYKHCDTRRYLNLDAAGHSYRYNGATNVYAPYPTAIEAADHVLS